MRQTFANLESRLSARPARSCDRWATAAKFWAMKDKALLLSSSICTKMVSLRFAHMVQTQVMISSHATAEAQHRDCTSIEAQSIPEESQKISAPACSLL